MSGRIHAASLPVLVMIAAGMQSQEAGPWRDSYDEAFAEARPAGEPLLLFFPPTGNVPDPPVLAAVNRYLATGTGLHAVRVGSDEVADLMARFAVVRLPAIVLVDSRENVVGRWEGPIQPTVARVLAQRLLELQKRGAREIAKAEAVRSLVDRGRNQQALETLLPLLQSPFTHPRALELARALEDAFIKAGEEAFLRALAAEGLVSRRLLRTRLEDVLARHAHPAIQQLVLDELKRTESYLPAGGLRAPR